jgi:octaheme c-type cytochrome (tetrathionate reductase family)
MHTISTRWYPIFAGIAAAVLLAALLLWQTALAQEADTTPLFADQLPADALQVKIDHASFPSLQGPFETPQDVTKACLSCHAQAGQQIMHTTHWTWEYFNEATGQTLGKKTLINNFCVAVSSNEPRCTSCHVGYGWQDKDFDFSDETQVDCLVCHDTTALYKKFPTGAGLPVSEPKEFPAGSGNIWQPPDLAAIAQNVGLTSRQTCGACHFYGGGGDEVKHGDLDSSLVTPAFELDVHMSPDGQDFSCTTCHMTAEHEIVGSRYSQDPEQWRGCQDCHQDEPHKLSVLNTHAQKVACQTCHIPEFARGDMPTKMTWDWSKAGDLTAEGKPVVIKDESGHVIYDGQKGAFTLEENVIPDYVWFNGQVRYTLAGEKIDPSGSVPINTFLGSRDDPQARIYPVKRFQAVQPYDPINKTLVIPHLFGKDEFAYWGNFDWDKAVRFGMDYAGLPYSGKVDFIETEMLWPITHMVAPAQSALQCRDCHSAESSRLDFAALGYADDSVKRLTNFPPTLSIEKLSIPVYSPDSCASCHEDEHALWSQSFHGDNGVGCITCHKPLEDGEHPTVALTMDKSAETCGACHLDQYDDWQLSAHGQINVTCATCHNPHSQRQMTIDDFQTTCETCHHETRLAAQHSTHLRANLICTDCHKNTDQNSGHTFLLGSDTCLKCHAENIHTADLMVQAGVDIRAVGTGRQAPLAQPAALEQAGTVGGGIGVDLPTWALILAGVIAGGGVQWLLSTRRLENIAEPDAREAHDQDRHVDDPQDQYPHDPEAQE